MSQLDYLWVNYGNFQVSTTPNDNPNNILTQEASDVKSYVDAMFVWEEL